MSDLVLGSFIALWLVVLFLALCVVALFRQLGVLHLRFGPRGALVREEGPKVGEQVPQFQVTDLAGVMQPGLVDGSATTLVFVAPGCAACKVLQPAIRALGRNLPTGHRMLVVSNGDHALSEPYLLALGDVPVIANPEIFTLYAVEDTPYVLHIDAQGLLRRKGVVNTLEQLESIVEGAGVELAVAG